MRKALIALVASLAAGQALAATTFTSTVTVANGELMTTLAWNSDRASCVASGHEAWMGPKPAMGSETLPTITLSGSYTLTLTCSSPADDTATLTWTPPTQNTDGTPLLNLTGYKVYWGTTPGQYPNSVEIMTASQTMYVVDGLTPGTWRFAVTALNSVGAESEFSNVAMKTITDAVIDEESVTLTVNPIPEAPTNLTVQ